jgi:hypothetical protein
MVTSYLGMPDHIRVQDERDAIPIITLTGDQLIPHGEIELRFYGNGGMNRRTYLETFQVVDVDADGAWEIIIGNEFLEKNGIYKRFALVGIHPRITESGFFSFPSWSFGPFFTC